MTDSIKNGLLRGKSYALLFKDDAAIKDITDAINDLETLATEAEQLRDEVRQLNLACEIHEYTNEQLRKERDDAIAEKDSIVKELYGFGQKGE